jgi:hypothetical protein
MLVEWKRWRGRWEKRRQSVPSIKCGLFILIPAGAILLANTLGRVLRMIIVTYLIHLAISLLAALGPINPGSGGNPYPPSSVGL